MIPLPNTTERALPADINAERATLGACLLERDAIIAIAPWLKPDMFYLEKHAWIYQAMLACYLAKVPPDTATVADELRRLDRLDAVGGIVYLGELSAEVPTAVHVEYYAGIVEQTSVRRRLIEAGGQIAAHGYNERDDLDTTLSNAARALTAASDRIGKDDAVILSDYVTKWHERFSGMPDGLPSGFAAYDRLAGGFHDTDLVVLAGRPAMGKTALGLQLAYNVASQGEDVLFFSMEMGIDQLMNRLVALVGNLDVQQLMRCAVAGARQQDFIRAVAKVREVAQHIHLQDRSVMDAPAIRWQTLRHRNRHGPPALVVVDYLQKMRGDAKVRDQVHLAVGENAIALKALAKEVPCPVLAISSVNRDGTGNQRLQPHNLGGSGQIEYEADQILLINPGEDTTERNIELAKHRNGPQGSFTLKFNPTSASFYTPSYSEVSGY